MNIMNNYTKLYLIVFFAFKLNNIFYQKKMLRVFCRLLKKIVIKSSQKKNLGLITLDKNMIFSSKKTIIRKNLQIEQISSGYLSQLLEKLNIINFDKISDQISDSIWNLEVQISLGNNQLEDYKNNVLSNIESLEKNLI